MKPSEFIAVAKIDTLSKLKAKNIKVDNYISSIESIYDAIMDSIGKTEPKGTLSIEDNLRKAVEMINDKYFKKDHSDWMSISAELNENDYCHMLLKLHWENIPEPIKNLIDSGNVDVGLIENEWPLVQCHDLRNENYAILFSRGLQRILYSILRTFTNCLVPKGENATISFEEIVSIMEDDFYVFEKTYSISPRKQVEISKDQVVFASNLCVIAEMFYLFHEFSHILIGEVVEGEDEFKADPKDEEYLADYFAMVSCFAIKNELPSDIVYAGCECALLVFSMLDKLKLCPTSSTHPLFSERITSLRQLLKKDFDDKSRYNAIISIGQITETIFNNIVNNVDSQSPSYIEFILDKKKNIEANIDDLLASHWNWKVSSDEAYITPNYSDFTDGMLNLLDSGYYRLVYNKLFSAYGANLSKIKKQSEYTKESTGEGVNNYFESLNNVKLIYHFISSLHEPLATVFADILENSIH
jgi:hypothetical protein